MENEVQPFPSSLQSSSMRIGACIAMAGKRMKNPAADLTLPNGNEGSSKDAWTYIA